MGVPNPGATQRVRAVKEQNSDMTDSLNTETRTLQNNTSTGTSLTVNITDYARRTFDLEEGDEVWVESYHDRIVIFPECSDESE